MGSLLALLQVIIVTLGQGALTLCVRQDGTQALEWTWANECQFQKTASHAAFEQTLCCDEVRQDETAFRCDPCTDYVLVAEQIVLLNCKVAPEHEENSDWCWYLSIVLDGSLLHHPSLLTHPPPLPLLESLSEFGVIGVLRC